MYTQCPECQVAFRITAQVLQKAGGRVRCGGCGSAFSAIDNLSEQLPGSASNPPADAEQAAAPESARDDLADKSKALLKTLDELAGNEQVRIEDTGIEWRVLDDTAANADVEDQQTIDDKTADSGSVRRFVDSPDGSPPQSDDEEVRYDDSGIVRNLRGDAMSGDGRIQDSLDWPSAGAENSSHAERRYDDNTPLPDDFEDSAAAPQISPQRRASDLDQIETDFERQQIILDIGDDDEWAELLDEEPVSAESEIDLSDQLAAADARQIADDSALLPELAAEVAEDLTRNDHKATAVIPIEVEEELAAIHNELAAGAAAVSTGTNAALPADLDSQFNTQAEALGLDITRNEERAPDGDRKVSVERDRNEISDFQAEDRIEPDRAEIKHLAEEHNEPDRADTKQLAEEHNEPDRAEINHELALDPEPAEDAADLADTSIAEMDAAADVDGDDDELPGNAGVELPEEDDLSPEQEASIVDKLRESTGEFQKQIEAAQRALEAGELETYGDPARAIDETHSEGLRRESADLAAMPAPDELPGDEVSAQSDDNFEGNMEDALFVPRDGEAPDSDDGAPGSEDDAPGTDDKATKSGDSSDISDAHEMLSQTMIQAGIDPATLDSENVETIVMEGDFVGRSLDDEKIVEERKSLANFDDPGFLADTYMQNKGKVRGGRRKSDPVGFGTIAAIAGLVLLLVAQYLHASRNFLATYGAFNQTIGPIYRALGKPVTPEWNVKGWQFETTNHSTDDYQESLTLVSQIRNASDQALPYPLVHVSLTDRWEEIIGSNVLEPGEYLAGDLDPRKAVTPGDNFTAVIAIDSLSPNATGFKLNVCYRVSPGRVRCATEDFKE